MPAPTNIDDASATLLVPGAVVTQQVADGGTTYTVVYKYENDTGADQVFAIWAYNDAFPTAGTGYRPQMTVYEGAAPDDNYLTFNYPMGAVELPILAGQTFYFWIYDDTGDDYTPSNLTIQFEIYARFDAPGVLADTRLLITSASSDSTFTDIGMDGLMAGLIDPYAHLSDPADSGEIVGFVPVMVTGEGGEVFQQSDRILLVDEAGGIAATETRRPPTPTPSSSTTRSPLRNSRAPTSSAVSRRRCRRARRMGPRRSTS